MDVVDTACFGVPQARKRLIMIGVRNDIQHPDVERDELHVSRFSVPAKYPLTAMETLEGGGDARYGEVV